MFLCWCLFYVLTSVFLFMLSVLSSCMHYRLYMTLRQGSLNLCLCEILMTVCSWNSCWNCCMSNNDHHHESADGDRWCHVVDGVWLDSWGEKWRSLGLSCSYRICNRCEQKSHWHTFWDTLFHLTECLVQISAGVSKRRTVLMICLMKKPWPLDIWLNFCPFSSHYIYHLKTSPGQNILLIYTFLSKKKIFLLCVLQCTRIKHLPMLFHIVWW